MQNYVSKALTTSILINNHKYTSNNEHHKNHCKDTKIQWTLHIKYLSSHTNKFWVHKHNIATKHQTLINKILSHLKIHIHMSHVDCKTQSYIWKSNNNYYKKILYLNSWSKRNIKAHESMYTIKTYNLIKVYIKHVIYIHFKCTTM